MVFRSVRSKRPPSNREAERPPKKSLEEACRDLKRQYGEEFRLRMNAALAARHAAEEDAVMSEVYGPGWKERLPSWAIEEVPSKVVASSEDSEEAQILPLRSSRQERRDERDRRRRAGLEF